MDRRSFLKWTGLGVAGTCAAPLAQALETARTEAAPHALKAGHWALAIDTRKCLEHDGCDLCIKACHLAHNVPALPEPEHAVKWIWKEPYERIFPEQVAPYMDDAGRQRPSVVLCNHCDNPPCVRVCPTKATWKRPDGLVMMDEHRCIGCRYCVVACPYGSRSFNWRDPRPYVTPSGSLYPTRTKGVVEKCTFCAERLAEGLQPLCVEACAKAGIGAMTFGDVTDPSSPIAALLRKNNVLRRKPSLGTGPHVFYIV
jgi:Fe-S-cluster-containing dehydrogenase component